MAEAPRYRFGPLERRGLLLGLRGSQLALFAAAGLASVFATHILSAGIALIAVVAIALAASLVAFVPLGGRSLDEWFQNVASWIWHSVLGRRYFVSRQPAQGVTPGMALQPEFPSQMRDLSILEHPLPGSSAPIGIVKARRAGTYIGILAVRGKSFALLDAPEKAHRLASWAGILAGLARERGVVHRLQWVDRTVPDPGDEIGIHLKSNLAVPVDSVMARSYLEVVDDAGPVTQQHEVLMALQVHAGRAAREVKAAGGGDAGACEVLRRELVSLSSQLAGAEVEVEGALTPRLVAHAMRTAFEPKSRTALAHMAAREPERAGTALANAAPLVAETSWSHYRSEGAWHATYWIAEWPRIDCDPDFLAPLLLRTTSMRTVSVTMEPISPLRALRSVRSARTSAAADEELRNRAGFVTTARRSREQEALASHERELADGHALYRFSGYVTVTALDHEGLELACGEVEEAAARSFLDLRRLRGQQDVAFTYTLPLCRGLR